MLADHANLEEPGQKNNDKRYFEYLLVRLMVRHVDGQPGSARCVSEFARLFSVIFR